MQLFPQQLKPRRVARRRVSVKEDKDILFMQATIWKRRKQAGRYSAMWEMQRVGP